MKRLALLVTLVLLISILVGTVGCASDVATPSPKPTTQSTSTPATANTPTPTPKATLTPTQPVQTATATPTPTPSASPSPTPKANPATTPAPTPTPKPLVLKLSCAYPDSTPRGAHLKKFKEIVEKYTGGRISIQLFTAGVLFPAKAEWEAVLTGAVDMSYTPPYYLRTAVPQNQVWHLKNTWEGYEHGWAVLKDGRIPKILHDLAWDKGMKQLGVIPTGVLTIILSKKKELRGFKDMAGLKYGATGEPLPLYSKYGGVVPVVIATGEEFLALSQGIVELVSGGPSTMVSQRLYEVADYALAYSDSYLPTTLLMNKDRWNSLSADIQDMLMNKVIPELQEYAQSVGKEMDAKDIATMKARLKAVNTATVEDLAAAREFLKDDPQTKSDLAVVGSDLLKIVDELRPSKNK